MGIQVKRDLSSIIRKEMKKWEKRLEALEREYRRMPEGGDPHHKERRTILLLCV